MELYLQFGYGMMAMCSDLLKSWGSGGVILSPRDQSRDQIIRTGNDISALGREALIDPQCYIRSSNHERLTGHAYWQAFRANSTANFESGQGAEGVLRELAALARAAGVKRHILPGLIATEVDAPWLCMQEGIAREAASHFLDEPVFATIALSSDALRNEDQLEAVVDAAAKWPVNGFYVVAESPDTYLVNDPIWLGNLLVLTSGLRLQGREVIVGYCSHQMLCLASANVDAIASGTWMNVRSFGPEKFQQRDAEEKSRRATWYYDPHGLSEYKLNFLDLANNRGLLGEMRPPEALGCDHASPLFSGAQPTSVEWGEGLSFRHYLTCLRSQARTATEASFTATMTAHRATLEDAQVHLGRLRDEGISGQDRDFTDYVDVNRAALISLDRARGPQLRRQW